MFGFCSCLFLATIVIYYLLRYLWELIPLRDLQKKTVFVTGCDTGFGRLLALKLAANSIHVFAGCLTDKGAADLKKDANGSSKLETIMLDVSSQQSVSAAFDRVKQLLDGRDLWALVNNAGIFTIYGPDDWCSIDDYQRAFDVNTLGVIRVTQAFKPLIKQSRGRIVTVTSTCGRISLPFTAPYSASKYATEAYMDAIRQELHVFGVTCCILEPSGFRTPLIDNQAARKRIENVWTRLSDDVKHEYGKDGKEQFIEAWKAAAHDTASTRFDYVVDNYYHAITARFPRLRYRCGYESIFIWIPGAYLPTELLDWATRFIVTKEFNEKLMKNAAAKWSTTEGLSKATKKQK